MNATTTTTNTVTINVTIDGETRALEARAPQFRDGTDTCYIEGVVACRIGRGAKVHRGYLRILFFETEEVARSLRWKVEEQNGILFAVDNMPLIRNARATVIGWADDYEGSAVATRQDYYGSL